MTDFQIPEPCHENWDAMTPQERGRHCDVCDKVVVDFTAMSAQEGRQFLEQAAQERGVDRQGGSVGVCARVHVDKRRHLLFGKIKRHVLTNGLAMMFAFAGAGCAEEAGVQPAATNPPSVETPVEDPRPLAGEVCVPEMMGDLVVPAPDPVSGTVDVPPQPVPEPVETGEVMVPDPDHTILGGKVIAVPVDDHTVTGIVVAPPEPAPQPEPDPKPTRGRVMVPPPAR